RRHSRAGAVVPAVGVLRGRPKRDAGGGPGLVAIDSGRPPRDVHGGGPARDGQGGRGGAGRPPVRRGPRRGRVRRDRGLVPPGRVPERPRRPAGAAPVTAAVDVAVVGSPFLDLTFEGLPRVPLPGEELVGRALHVAPGGTGMQAIGLARLGLSVTLVAPLGSG